MRNKKIMFFEDSTFQGKPGYTFWIPKYLYETKNYNVKVVAVKPFDRSRYNLLIFNLPIFEFAGHISFFKKFMKFKPDVLVVFQTFGPRPIAFIKLFAKLTNIKTKIIVCPDFTPRIFKIPANPLVRAIKNVFRYISMWFQANTANYLVCWTEFEKIELQRIFKIKNKKFKIIPLGFQFEIGTTNKECYILSVAQWTQSKNLPIIISVFNEVAKENKNVKLVIVGGIEEACNKEIEGKLMNVDLNIKERIRFTGPILDRNKLEKLYKKAKIFYLPSIGESFGMVFVEAMASGTPIVAYPDSAVPYVIKDKYTGFLCKTEDEQKEAILKLLNDEELYEKMQENCLKEAKKYKWEDIIKSWAEVIE